MLACVMTWLRNEETMEVAIDLGCGAAMVPCPDCDGTGIFSGPEDEDMECVMCKTSGAVLISI